MVISTQVISTNAFNRQSYITSHKILIFALSVSQHLRTPTAGKADLFPQSIDIVHLVIHIHVLTGMRDVSSTANVIEKQKS